ncbi:DUF2147 domain-containing protein [uncultured Aquimarina sp.]|uniref:DUF2147 domain-containing protein n=1 Tax=uncultured Aquimarina sp. TaxID=575652 RepID=UPI0026212FAB|nr:DUF2147 domain-containing protein [uncultured Aquimarina sp.]
MNVSKILIVALIFITSFASAQSEIIGKWKTIDDNTGEAKSIVVIYKKGSKIYGKIDRILKESDRDKLCKECEGEDYNKPIEGMVILKGLQKDGNEYEDGTIMDPENGKVYKCKIWVDEDDPNVLNVRGYIAFLFRTQQWIKA